MTTKIEWVARPGTIPETWNPVTGCTKVSEGCRNCYAERMAKRLAGRFGYPEAPNHFDVTLHPDRLEKPLKWKKPRTVFVCSMGDLFHEDVPLAWVEKVYLTMKQANQHTFLLLTKRPARMKVAMSIMIQTWEGGIGGEPLPNVWLGVTAENQATADERIPLLLQTPAAVRFVSCEPLLGEIDISDALNGMPEPYGGGHRGYVSHDMALDAEDPSLEGESLGWQEPEWQQTAPPLDWVIAGGESGPGARPMHPDWARGIRDQCQAAGVPFFFKQWGRYALLSAFPIEYLPPRGIEHTFDDHKEVYRVGKKAAGRLLDGREWNEWPNDVAILEGG